MKIRENYESPVTTCRKVVMESSCMAASDQSASPREKLSSMSLDTEGHDNGANWTEFGGETWAEGN